MSTQDSPRAPGGWTQPCSWGSQKSGWRNPRTPHQLGGHGAAGEGGARDANSEDSGCVVSIKRLLTRLLGRADALPLAVTAFQLL